MIPLVVIVLTFNSEASLGQVIESCRPLGGRRLVVDSYSTDGTVELAHGLGCEVVQHPFENYSQQRNWAQSCAQIPAEGWVLHLDSDEVLTAELAESIQAVLVSPEVGVEGYLVRRLPYFLGRPIRFGHLNPGWHLRLYRAERGYCEERLYDQHFVVDGPVRKLGGLLNDLQLVSLEKWTASHNRWSTLEAAEILQRRASERTLRGDLRGKDPRARKRWLKNNLWYRSPPLLRALLFFIYAYFLRLGFLDGRIGLIYYVLQAFWFRFLVDAKLIEQELAAKEVPAVQEHR